MSGAKDAEVFGRVRWALEKSPTIGSADSIRLKVENGVVRMWGEVSSDGEKSAAESLARAQQGVKDVENALTIAMSTPRLDERKEVARAVEKALDVVRSHVEGDVGVRSIERGIVRLAGRVSSLADERRAIEAVAAVHGIGDVASDIVIGEVAPGEMIGIIDDVALKGMVSRAMALEGVTIYDEGTVVDGGVAYLRGHVTGDEDRRHAEESATRVRGISDVVNELVVDHRTTSTNKNESLAALITQALQVDGRVSPADVHVEAVDGDVYLFGYVDSIEDLNAAAEVARRVPGVASVFNDIVLRDRSTLGKEGESFGAKERTSEQR